MPARPVDDGSPAGKDGPTARPGPGTAASSSVRRSGSTTRPASHSGLIDGQPESVFRYAKLAGSLAPGGRASGWPVSAVIASALNPHPDDVPAEAALLGVRRLQARRQLEVDDRVRVQLGGDGL